MKDTDKITPQPCQAIPNSGETVVTFGEVERLTKIEGSGVMPFTGDAQPHDGEHAPATYFATLRPNKKSVFKLLDMLSIIKTEK